MIKLFKEIDNIPWSNLRHAYGTADDIPKQLKALLLMEDVVEARRALSCFFWNIYHQGTIYSATPHTIPFLIEALHTCPISFKNHLINLLTNISYGLYCNVNYDVIWQEEEDTMPDKFQEEPVWIKQSVLSIWEGWDYYIELMNESDNEIRLNIPLILVSLAKGDHYPPNRNRETIHKELHQLLINHLFDETDPLVQASYIRGINSLDFPIRKKRAFLSYYMEEDAPIVQLTAAFSLLEQGTNDEAIEILFQVADNKKAVDEIFVPFPWFKTHFSSSVLELLSKLPSNYLDLCLPIFESYIRGTYKFCAKYTITPIIKMVFQNQKINELSEPLTHLQKKILACIIETPLLWDKSDGNTNLAFKTWGLKRDKEFIRTLIKKGILNE